MTEDVAPPITSEQALPGHGDLKVLAEEAKKRWDALPEEEKAQLREEQDLCFAYGNLACTDNHKPTREAFAKLAEERGWTAEQFERWAMGRKWWKAKSPRGPIFMRDVLADPSILTRSLPEGPSRAERAEQAEDAMYEALGEEIERHPIGGGGVSRG